MLFLLVFTSPIEKKAIDREHHSSKGVHFEFHVSKVHLYICRVIFIFLLLYSDLYCKKKLPIFYGSNSCYNDNCSKK